MYTLFTDSSYSPECSMGFLSIDIYCNNVLVESKDIKYINTKNVQIEQFGVEYCLEYVRTNNIIDYVIYSDCLSIVYKYNRCHNVLHIKGRSIRNKLFYSVNRRKLFNSVNKRARKLMRNELKKYHMYEIRYTSTEYIRFGVTKDAEIIFDVSLFNFNVPVELRQIILKYYGNQGFMEYEMYKILVTKSDYLTYHLKHARLKHMKYEHIGHSFTDSLFNSYIQVIYKCKLSSLDLSSLGHSDKFLLRDYYYRSSLCIYPLLCCYMYEKILKQRKLKEKRINVKNAIENDIKLLQKMRVNYVNY
jgi:hypothetical protein